MSCNSEELTQNTISYIQNTPIEKRKSLGQYFTPRSIREQLWEQIPREIKQRKLSVLEPSCGTGEFLSLIDSKIPNNQISKKLAIEIDEGLSKTTKIKYNNWVVQTADFLTFVPQKNDFDLIIGNPPYFEFKTTADQKKEFYEIIKGRTNIYAFFIKKAIDLLGPGGCLAFVVPPSMNNGAYFNKLRKYIIKYCSIRSIKTVEQSNKFDGANQKVMLLVLVKEKNDDKFVFSHRGKTIFTNGKYQLENMFKKSKTLLEIGYKAKTGTIVWNQNKNLLSNNKHDTVLLWSHNIKNNSIVTGNKPNKPQFIKRKPEGVGPAIIVNRVTGSSKNAKIRAAVIPDGYEYCAENHINVITPTIESPVLGIKELHRQITSIETADIIKLLTGNTQISKSELENLIPFIVKA